MHNNNNNNNKKKTNKNTKLTTLLRSAITSRSSNPCCLKAEMYSFMFILVSQLATAAPRVCDASTTEYCEKRKAINEVE